MKLAAVNPTVDFDIDDFINRQVNFQNTKTKYEFALFRV